LLYLMADTCVWLDIAKNIRGEQQIAAVRVLVHQHELQLLVPKLVTDEFERNREQIEVVMSRRLDPTFRAVRTVLGQHGHNDERDRALDQLTDLEYRNRLANQLATRHFDEILELLQGGRVLEPTPEIEEKVVLRGLAKQAPFHRNKNSVADALLIEMYGAAESLSEDDNFCFVTSNTNDFSLTDGDVRQPHPDLAPFFASPRSDFYTNLQSALFAHFGDEARELFDECDIYEEPRGLDEIRPEIDKLWDQIWYNRHKSLENRIATGEISVVDEYDPANHERIVTRAVWQMAQAAARRKEEQYGFDDLGPWPDFEWGMLSGKMAALRWAMGEDWESTLDT
jgi:PIN domain